MGFERRGVVALKENHGFAQGGPCRLVRRPIYSGMLLIGLGTDLMHSEGFGIAVVVFGVVAFDCEIRVGEKPMSQQFPSQYGEYRRR